MERKLVTVLSEAGIKFLHQKSEAVAFSVLENGSVCLDAQTLELIEDMKNFVQTNEGLGISAVQLGVHKAIFVMRPTPNNLLVVINPTLMCGSELEDGPEGCFSIPLPAQHAVRVSRQRNIVVSYDTPEGERVTTKMTGLPARIFQHELDHLHGKIMIDESIFGGWSKF